MPRHYDEDFFDHLILGKMIRKAAPAQQGQVADPNAIRPEVTKSVVDSFNQLISLLSQASQTMDSTKTNFTTAVGAGGYTAGEQTSINRVISLLDSYSSDVKTLIEEITADANSVASGG